MRRSSAVSTSWGNIATFDLAGISVDLRRDLSPGPSPFWGGEQEEGGAQRASMAGETAAPPVKRNDERERSEKGKWAQGRLCRSKFVNSWCPAEKKLGAGNPLGSL